MDRRSQQNHIRAARDWLGRAEDSLARENDVQGDLKLMLAKAELAHVEHSSKWRGLTRWGSRIAAFLAAALLAGAMLWEPAAPPVEQVPAEALAESGQQAAGSTPQPSGDTEVLAARQEPPPVQLPETPEPPRPAASTQQGWQPEVQQPAAAPERPQPPNVEKQQLMQSAGKILRQ